MTTAKRHIPQRHVSMSAGLLQTGEPRIALWAPLALSALPVTAALGPSFLLLQVAGLGLYPFRLLVIALLFYAPLLIRTLDWRRTAPLRSFIFLLYLWAAWAALASFWAPDILRALRDTLAIGFALGLAIVLFHLRAHRSGGITALRRGWNAAYFVTAAIAVWEIRTGDHLSSSVIDDAIAQGKLYVLDRYIQSSFGNPNDYAAFLLMSLPMLAWSATAARRIPVKAFWVLAMCSVPLFLIYTSSVLAMFGLALEVIAILLFSARSALRLLAGLFTLLIVLSASLVWMAQVTPWVLADIFGAVGLIEAGGAQGSSSVRTNLILNGAWLFYRSGGVGIGPGGFEFMHERGLVPWPTQDIINPHNFWIEILSEYGAVAALLFLAWLCYAMRIFWRTRRIVYEIGNPAILASRMMMVSLLAYPFMAVTASSYLSQSTNWMFLGTVAAAAAYALSASHGLSHGLRRNSNLSLESRGTSTLRETNGISEPI